MSLDIGVMFGCGACKKSSQASQEYHGGGRLTFVTCRACGELHGRVADDEQDLPETPCPCGGTLKEWDHQTCPHCGAKVEVSWTQAYN